MSELSETKKEVAKLQKDIENEVGLFKKREEEIKKEKDAIYAEIHALYGERRLLEDLSADEKQKIERFKKKLHEMDIEIIEITTKSMISCMRGMNLAVLGRML